MALKLDKYGDADSNLVIFFPYPWGGERHNNRELLEKIAGLTGALVLGAQTPGTGKMYIERATRRQLKPVVFSGLATDYAGEVNDYLNQGGKPVRLLAAQSGRVALGAHMQISPHRPFTHVLLRDGVNLCAPETAKEGFARLTAQPSVGEYGPSGLGERKSPLHRARDFRARWHGRIEVLNQAELLCSTESAVAVEGLAADTDTPLYHLTIKNGITGSEQQQLTFQQDLLGLRADFAQGLGASAVAAPIKASVVPGNHADLQHPGLFYDHISQALAPGMPMAELTPYPGQQ